MSLSNSKYELQLIRAFQKSLLLEKKKLHTQTENTLWCFQSSCQNKNIQNQVLFELTIFSYTPAKVAIFIFWAIMSVFFFFLNCFYGEKITYGKKFNSLAVDS